MKLRPDEDDIAGMWNVFKYLIGITVGIMVIIKLLAL